MAGYGERVYGEFLRRVRRSRGLSQEALGEVAGVSQPNISAYENDRRTPSLDTFNRLVVACGYQVAADGGPIVHHLPLPKAGWFWDDDLPPRLTDDPPDQQPQPALDSSPEDRARALVSVFESTEAILIGRSRR